MTPTLGRFLLGVGISLMEPNPWRELGTALRRRVVSRKGAVVVFRLNEWTETLLKQREAAERAAHHAKGGKGRKSQIIGPSD